MRNKIAKWLTVCLLFMVLVGCRSQKTATVTETREIKEIVRDTVVWVKADSVQSVVQIDCTDKDKPKLKTISETKGRKLKPSQLTLDGNNLKIDCKAEAEQMALKLYDKYVKEHKKEVVIQQVEKPFRWYHIGLMALGAVSLLLLAYGLLQHFKR